jgi:hypothetical protein
MFVFDILQIPSGVCRFVVGVLHPHWLWAWFTQSISVLGVLTSWWISLLWHFWEICQYPPEPNAFALKTRQQVPLQCQNNLPVYGVRTKLSSLQSQGYTRVSQPSERLSFSGRQCAVEIMLWQTGKQSFLFQASISCCHRIMIWYSQVQRMYLSWGRVPLQITLMLVGWQWNWCYLWACYVCLTNCHTKHKMLIFDPRTARCNPKLLSQWVQTFLKLLLTPELFFTCKFLDIFKHYDPNIAVQNVTTFVLNCYSAKKK